MLVTKTTLFCLLSIFAIVNAQEKSFQAANKALASQLDSQKMGLSIGSPCPQQFIRDGSVICAGNQLARCNGGLVSGPLQDCAGGLNCQVLPLVNSPGVSVTCDTDDDKIARIGNGVNTPSNSAGNPPIVPLTPTPPKDNLVQPSQTSSGASTSPAVAGNGGFQAANKALASQLDGQKVDLSLGSRCPQQFSKDGAVLCVGNKLGLCIDGTVSGPLQECAIGLNCQVLPLINSPGVSVTCDTDADKLSRIGNVDTNVPVPSSSPTTTTTPVDSDEDEPIDTNDEPVEPSPSLEPIFNATPDQSKVNNGGFQAANKVLAGQLDGQKMGLNIGSSCPQPFNRDGAVLCVGNQLGRCNGGLVSGPLQDCGVGLNCQVLPLVNSPGVSVTCDTDADKNTRIGL